MKISNIVKKLGIMFILFFCVISVIPMFMMIVDVMCEGWNRRSVLYQMIEALGE